MIWVWLWTLDACEGGDINAVVAKAKQHRVGVMIKTHDGATSNPNGQRGFLLIEALRAAGVPVRAWGYCYPDVHPRVQAYFAAQAGTDYIADVEVEWDGHPAEAEAFVTQLRQAMPGRLIGYAPLPIVSYHDFGQYGAFNQLDVACPQAYAGTGGRDAIGALSWTEEEWARAFPGCNIEPAVYAADQTPESLRAAIGTVHERAVTFGHDGDVSVWSWQHMIPEHWAVIAEFTRQEEEMPDETTIREWAKQEARVVIAKEYGPALEAELRQRFAENTNADIAAAIAGAVKAVGERLTA